LEIIDAGHKYKLTTLDGEADVILTFVKREGKKYPGNEGSYPGTTIQEVCRVLIDRCRYVNNQTPSIYTKACINLLLTIIILLETRASMRHDTFPIWPEEGFDLIDNLPKCSKCGHITCHH
jgi:hypothetical protein